MNLCTWKIFNESFLVKIRIGLGSYIQQKKSKLEVKILNSIKIKNDLSYAMIYCKI